MSKWKSLPREGDIWFAEKGSGSVTEFLWGIGSVGSPHGHSVTRDGICTYYRPLCGMDIGSRMVVESGSVFLK